MPPPEPPESLIVIDVLAERLDALGIGYLVGGSVASSLHGIFRATNDVDLVVDLPEDKVDVFAAALRDDFYVDADMIRESLQTDISFNVIHLPTMVKADLFPRKQTPFGRAEWSRRRLEQIRADGQAGAVYVASAEDMILQKLEWYRPTGERSDRQWGDVQGMFKVQGRGLDFPYLRRWAGDLELDDLLNQALADAGLTEA